MRRLTPLPRPHWPRRPRPWRRPGLTATGAAAATAHDHRPGAPAAARPLVRAVLRDVRRRRRPGRAVTAVRREVPDARLPADRGGRVVHGVLDRRGTPLQPIAAVQLRGPTSPPFSARGGRNVIPSFGGYRADTASTEPGRQLHEHPRGDRQGVRRPDHDLPRAPHPTWTSRQTR